MSVRHLGTFTATIAAAVLAGLAPAAAHTGTAPAFGFAAGMLHPFSGLDHLLAMLAVGLMAGLIGGRALWLVPASFIAAMLAGGSLAAAQIALPAAEIAIAASVVVLGLAAAAPRPTPVALAMGVAAAFAIFHGHAHGAEMPAGASALAYGLGFTCATLVLHGLGIAASLAAGRVPVGRLALRAGGGAIGALGVLLLLA
jgi:urease accessory protein